LVPDAERFSPGSLTKGAAKVARRVLIRGGVVSTDTDVFRADVIIDGEHVSGLTSDSTGLEADEVIDASDKLVVPGGIDAHTHFKDPDPNQIEGFYYGSMGAVAGGISSGVEMPQKSPQNRVLRLIGCVSSSSTNSRD
jgi:dihydroorotase-like cyclic amidohydrolase